MRNDDLATYERWDMTAPDSPAPQQAVQSQPRWVRHVTGRVPDKLFFSQSPKPTPSRPVPFTIMS